MINNDEALALNKWINEWKKTYGENPTFEECLSWINWKFERSFVSNSDLESIKVVLKKEEY